MIFEKVEHMGLYAFDCLPTVGDGGRGVVGTLYAAQGVVEIHLVIEVVKTAGEDEVAIEMHVINLGDKPDVGIAVLDIGYGPLPELERHHKHHVTPEGVNAFRCPEAEYVEHLEPGVGYGVVVTAAVERVAAIVELHGLIPVVDAREGREAVIARSFGRKFDVGLLAGAQVDGGGEKLAGDVIIIVGGREKHVGVIVRAEILDTGGSGVGVIAAGGVVGHKVDDYLHAGVVSAGHESLKLGHTVVDIDSNIGVHVIIVLDSVRRAGLTLDHVGIVGRRDALVAIIGLGGVLYDACIPHGRHAEFLDAGEHAVGDVVHLARAVLREGAVGHTVGIGVGE